MLSTKVETAAVHPPLGQVTPSAPAVPGCSVSWKVESAPVPNTRSTVRLDVCAADQQRNHGLYHNQASCCPPPHSHMNNLTIVNPMNLLLLLTDI